MKKLLLFVICISFSVFFLSSVVAQNTVEVTVFHDLNGNGIDDTEPTLPGIGTAILTLWEDIDGLGFVNAGDVQYLHTEAGGVYTFGSGGLLPDNNYILQYVETAGPGNYQITSLNSGGATVDSDVDPFVGYSLAFTVTGGVTEVDIDLGLILGVSVGDFVWDDQDGNGLQTAGEPGIGGVTINLLDDMSNPVVDVYNVAVGPQLTMADGSFLFSEIPPGDYIVQFSLPTPVGATPWFATTFNTDVPDNSNDSDADPTNSFKSPILTITSGLGDFADNINMSMDAGFYVPVKIGDKVFCDENGNGIDDDGVAGVDNIMVRLIDEFTGVQALDPDGNLILDETTNSGGMYEFELVPPGSYTVEFGPLNLPFVFSLQDEITATEDTDSDVDPINGQVNNIVVTSQSTDEEMRVDAGVYQIFIIRGDIWIEDDMNNTYNGEPGPGGILVNLYDGDTGAKIDFVNTNTGVYEFPSNNSIQLGPGNYYVELDASAFMTGGPLNGASPCPGNNDANDMVDNDDNGMDGIPALSTTFTLLSNCDPTTPPEIEYVDFCYFFDCNTQNELAASACGNISDADIICDISILGSFCNLMPTEDSSDNTLSPLCLSGGGAPHNISWFAFVAFDGTYTVTVTPTACTGSTTGIEGVQIGLYTDCTYAESVYCDPECNINPVSFDSDLMEPGQTYYFFIDGCSSSVCSYEVEISGNPVIPSLMPDDVCIDNNGTIECTDAIYCPDTDVTFSVTGLNLTVDFSWAITTISGGPFVGNTNPTTSTDELDVSFGNEGEYEICVTNIDNGCPGMMWSGNICRTVTIEGLDDEPFPAQMLCVEDLASFDINIFNSDDPNGDGTTGWQAGGTFDFGTNTGTVTTPEGCMYEQEFDLVMLPSSDPYNLDTIICGMDLPIMIGEIPITETTFAGNLTFSLPDFQLTSVSDVNGCDSTLNLTIEQLVITNGFIKDPFCLPEGILLDFEFLEDLSTNIENITFVWTDPDDNILVDDFMVDDPTNIIAPNGSSSGIYTLITTIEKNGVMCELPPYTINVDFSSFFPPNPMLTGEINICEADSIVTYTAVDGGDAFEYVWTYPNDVTSATLSGNKSEMLTINWSGSDGGDVTVIGKNACGESEEVQVNVTLIPQSTPAFTTGSEVCVGNSVMIEYSGDPADVMSYVWDFDGGTVAGTGGVGPGPHPVTWVSAGTKTITLSIIDKDGCPSKISTQLITVIAPISPPIVSCDPDDGEVTFTWDDVAGADSYDVNVLSGQSGTLIGNTFTVTGLGNNETVNIELIVYTNDACMSVTGTAPGCTAQDCTPPQLTLTPAVTSICLDGTNSLIAIDVLVSSGEGGVGIFGGPGVDSVTGDFDPTAANLGENIVTYNYTTDAGCIANGQTIIEVFATPSAGFTTDVDSICITDQFVATYTGTADVTTLDWSYGTDGSGPGGANPMITYTTPGMKTIELIVEKDGCTSEMVTKNVFVQPELALIEVTCLEQNLNSVLFGWNEIVGATGYEVTIGSNPPMIITDISEITTLVDNLSPGDIIDITVNVLSDSKCPPSSDTESCEAKACPTFVIDVDVPIVDYCVNGTNDLVDLVAIASGGVGGGVFTWSGDNVTDDKFDPNGLVEGSYNIIVEYIEEGCTGSSSVMINLTTEPTASFDVDNATICIGESVNLVYTGSQLSSQMLNWTSGGETVVQGINMNEYSTTFNSDGTFEIELLVENGDCQSETISQSITVEPLLVFDPIDCDESLDEIVFSWSVVDCATSFEVFIDGVSQGVQSETSYTVADLTEGQEVAIEVIAVSGCACGNVMQTRMCEARACPTIDITLSATQQEFCIGDDLLPIQIIDEVVGSIEMGTITWTGTEVDANGLFDPSAAGIGSHTIEYTYLESEGCDYTSSIIFDIYDIPEVDFTLGEINCYDQTTTMVELLPSGGSGTYELLLNGEISDLSVEVAIGSYDVVVTDDNMCSAMTSFIVSAVAEPSPSISGNVDLILGESGEYSIDPLVFNGQTINSIIWTANGIEICNAPDCFSITQTPNEDTEYVVIIHFNEGCSVMASNLVTVTEIIEEPISIVEIPNVISPNNDGNNDEWVIFSNDADVLVNSIKIYDRWGNKVFTVDNQFVAKDNTITWDGKFKNKALQPGVYVYFIDFVQEGSAKTRSGDITIVN